MPENREPPGDEQLMSAEELERLRAWNEALKARLEQTGKREKRGGLWRGFTVWLLIILACILSIAGVLSTWVKTTTLDTDTFVSTVAPLVKQDAVAEAATDIAVEKLFEAYDVTGRIETGLDDLSGVIKEVAPENLSVPDINLSFIAGPISNGLEGFAGTVARKILQSDQFYKVWERSLRTAHTVAVNIITGKTDALVTSRGDTVVLNLEKLLTRVKDELVDAGLGFLDKVPVPDNFGQIELFSAEQLGTAKSGVHLLEMLSWVLPLLAFVFFVLAVVIAEDRRKALLRAGIGLAIAMLITLIVLKVAHGQLFNQIKDAGVLAAADVVWGTVISGLRQAIWGLLVLGLVVGVGSGVVGPSRWAVWLREHSTDFFKNWRARREGEKGKTGFSAFIDRYAWWFRTGGLVVAAIVLVLLPTVSGLAVILTVIILGVYLVAVELLR